MTKQAKTVKTETSEIGTSIGTSTFYQFRAGVSERMEKLNESLGALNLRIDQLANQVEETRLQKLTPAHIPHGATLQVDVQTGKDLAREAQFIGFRDANQLAQIVLRAFIEMMEDDAGGHIIKFPLMLQQVEGE